MNKYIQWTINLGAGVFFFLFFLFLFFPLEDLANHLIANVETQTKGQYRLLVDEVNPSIFFKTKVKNLKLYERTKNSESLILDLPEAKIGVSYLPLIAGHVNASINALGKKGQMQGSFLISKDKYDIDLSFKDFSLDHLPYLSFQAGLPLKGQVFGQAKISYYPAEVSKSEGTIDLSLKQLVISKNRILKSGFDFDLPEFLLSSPGEAKFKLVMKNSKVDISQLSIPGPDLVMNVQGNILLNKKIGFSRLNINGTLAVSDKVREALPAIVLLDNEKNEQGIYSFNVSGRFNKPKPQIGNFDLSKFLGNSPIEGE